MRKPENEFHFKFLGSEITARGSIAVVGAIFIAFTLLMIWGLR